MPFWEFASLSASFAVTVYSILVLRRVDVSVRVWPGASLLMSTSICMLVFVCVLAGVVSGSGYEMKNKG